MLYEYKPIETVSSTNQADAIYAALPILNGIDFKLAAKTDNSVECPQNGISSVRLTRGYEILSTRCKNTDAPFNGDNIFSTMVVAINKKCVKANFFCSSSGTLEIKL